MHTLRFGTRNLFDITHYYLYLYTSFPTLHQMIHAILRYYLTSHCYHVMLCYTILCYTCLRFSYRFILSSTRRLRPGQPDSCFQSRNLTSLLCRYAPIRRSRRSGSRLNDDDDDVAAAGLALLTR